MQLLQGVLCFIENHWMLSGEYPPLSPPPPPPTHTRYTHTHTHNCSNDIIECINVNKHNMCFLIILSTGFSVLVWHLSLFEGYTA